MSCCQFSLLCISEVQKEYVCNLLKLKSLPHSVMLVLGLGLVAQVLGLGLGLWIQVLGLGLGLGLGSVP